MFEKEIRFALAAKRISFFIMGQMSSPYKVLHVKE